MTDLAAVFGMPPVVRGVSTARARLERTRFGSGVEIDSSSSTGTARFGLTAWAFGGGGVIPVGRTPALSVWTACPKVCSAIAKVQRHNVQPRGNFIGRKIALKFSGAQGFREQLSGSALNQLDLVTFWCVDKRNGVAAFGAMRAIR